MKNLVIVESPAKAKTIEKFLGKDYKVMSSYGHIRDLKKKNFSIDLDNNFSPIYEIPSDKTELVNELKKAAAQAETVWLASDEDREGEAIAWHLFETLNLKPENTKRIVFHEITKNAILNAIEHPRDIDINLVDAQQARRVIDRIVGFELSPVLWKKIKPALSAGRVQSVAVRLIVDREKEIKNFRSEEYFRLTADFTDPKGHQLHTELSHRLPSRPQAEEMLLKSASADFTVADITVKPVKKSPAPPFTTSTLQQEAARKLGFTVSQTMMVAQRLYEAGYITYMRTDSLNLSEMAVDVIADVINNMLGPEYHHARRYHTKSKGAQEAHEAIRPTDAARETIEGTQQEKRLYTLIRRRTIASQMADAVIEKTTIDIEATGQASTTDKPARFIASGEVIKFDGFLKIYLEGHDDNEDEAAQGLLPKLNKGDKMTLVDMLAQQRYTQQPARYNEASLVKKMEELGIGRPSTYAPTISTIQQREYVERADREGVRRDLVSLRLADGKITETVNSEVTGSEKGKLVPTDIGMVVNDFLTDYFPTILDYNFTANIEQKFDEIAEGNLLWNKEVGDFYHDFHPAVEDTLSMRLEHKVGERQLGVDPATGKPVSVKIGRFGPLVQIGEGSETEKPQFASLLKGQSMATITLDEALKLFEFPRTVGEYEGKDVTVAIGRFGPYVKHDNKFTSIPKDIAPAAITLDEAIELINAKREQERQRVVKTFDDEPDLQILNGRYGVYIAYKKSNYKIPKTVDDPKELTLDQCREIIAAQDAAPKKTTRRRKA